MPASLWWEWLAFFKLEPFGSRQDEYRFGQVAATIANSVRDPKKKPSPWTAEDFFASLRQRLRSQSWQEQLKIVEALNEAFGGKDLRDNGR